ISQMKASPWPIFSLVLKKLNKLSMSGVFFCIESQRPISVTHDPGGSLLDRPGKLTKRAVPFSGCCDVGSTRVKASPYWPPMRPGLRRGISAVAFAPFTELLSDLLPEE